MPIFAPEQLLLCNEKTLLLFKKKEDDPQDEGIIMLLESVDCEGKLNVSLSYDDENAEVKSFRKEDLFNYDDSQYKIYYYPDSPFDTPGRIDFVSDFVKEKTKEIPEKGAKKLVKQSIKAGIKESVSSGLKSAVAGKLMTPQLAKVIGTTATGPVIDMAINSGEAGVATYQHRRKEKTYEESGGINGFSRSRANKKIAKEWGGAASGAAGGVGSAVAITTGAAMAGQVKYKLLHH